MAVLLYRIILSCLLTIIFNSCFSFDFTANYERDIYLFQAAVEENTIDYSFPITGDIADSGVIVYKRVPSTPFALFRERKPLKPSPDGEITASGLFLTYKAEDNMLFVYVPAKHTNGIPEIHWTPYEYRYVWDGEIALDMVEKAKLVIYHYAADSEGKRRIVALDSAQTKDAEIEFNNYISKTRIVSKRPPYHWGKFISSGAKYNLYAVIEDDYYAKYPDYTERERKKTKWYASDSEVSGLDEFFLKKGQKFQLVDRNGAVVSEIFGNTFTIYDTLPVSEWDSMKRNIAMFYVYRLIVREIFSSSGFDISF